MGPSEQIIDKHMQELCEKLDRDFAGNLPVGMFLCVVLNDGQVASVLSVHSDILEHKQEIAATMSAAANEAFNSMKD